MTMSLKLPVFIGALIVTFSIATFATYAQEDVDPDTTSCKQHLSKMGRMSIDGAITLTPMEIDPNGAPMFVDPVYKTTIGLPPDIFAIVKQKKPYTWMAYHFMPTREVMAGFAGATQYNNLSGFTANLVMAFPDGCMIADDMLRDIHQMPKDLVMTIYINQQLVQSDGTYKTLTPEVVQTAAKLSTDAQLNKMNSNLNKIVTRNFEKYLKDLGIDLNGQ